MDNASIHNDVDLANLLRPLNMTLIKLPTYSYDLNPIEMVNGVAKVCAKRNPGLLRQKHAFCYSQCIFTGYTASSPKQLQN